MLEIECSSRRETTHMQSRSRLWSATSTEHAVARPAKILKLTVTWSMRATRVCHRPIQMLNLFAKQYALKIIMSFNKIPRLDVMSFLFHMVLGRCCTKENPGNVQTSAYECCKRSGAGARDGGYSSRGDRHHAQSVSTFEERCCIGSTTRPFVAGLRNMWRLLG
jgi:hypothetical protein